MAKKRFGLLSTIDAPLLGYQLRALIDRKMYPDAIFLDSKTISEKDIGLHEERTRDQMPAIPLHAFEDIGPACYFVENHNSSVSAKLIQRLELDFLINAGTPRKLGMEVLNSTPMGVLNAHPGLLPAFRGCSCVEWAVLLDEPVGVTVHRMSEGIDEGPTLLKKQVVIGRNQDYVALRVATYLQACAAMADAVSDLVVGNVTDDNFTPQASGRYFKPISNDDLQRVKEKLNHGAYKYQS